MTIIPLNVKEYKKKVEMKPLREPSMSNAVASELTFWEFIRDGSASFRAAHPEIHKKLSGTKEGEPNVEEL